MQVSQTNNPRPSVNLMVVGRQKRLQSLIQLLKSKQTGNENGISNHGGHQFYAVHRQEWEFLKYGCSTLIDCMYVKKMGEAINQKADG